MHKSINAILAPLTMAALLLTATPGIAQEMTVTDSDTNVLMQVNDEGDAGSITLPPAPAVPADTTNKLHNVGIGVVDADGLASWYDPNVRIEDTGTVSTIEIGPDSVAGYSNPDYSVAIGNNARAGAGSGTYPGIAFSRGCWPDNVNGQTDLENRVENTLHIQPILSQ